MTVSVVGSNNETVVFQTRKVKGSDLETDRALLDLDDIPVPAAINAAKGYTTFSEFYNDLPDNTDIQGPQGIQGPAIDSVSLAQSVDLSTVTMTFGYTQNNQGFTIGTTPSFTIPAGPTGNTGTGIQFVSHDTQNHTLTFQFTDTLSDLTVDLPQGDVGPAGRSISSISKSGDVMTINYDDGSSPTQISGIRGPAGDAATVTIASTNTLPAGSSASVTETLTSSSQNRELIFNIPQGVDGTDGISITDVNQVNSTTINFSKSDNTTSSNITLPTVNAETILPSYSGNAGKVLVLNSTATDLEWFAVSGQGTVSSIAFTASNGLTVSGSPVTTTGTIALGINLGQNLFYSTGDGSLNAIDTTYSNATQSVAGLMSSADKTKLDGVSPSANNYALPRASSTILGGIKVGTNLSIATDGELSAVDTTYDLATTSVAGLMSGTDKGKLDGIATSANNYSLPNASASTLGGIKVGTNLSIDGSGILSGAYNTASQGNTGLMSGADKSKLDNIESLANNYSLPTASSSVLGGIKVGTNLSIDVNGVLSSTDTDTTYSDATTTVAGLMSTSDKTKLDGIDTNANNYSLPTASASVLGGIKVGTNLSIDVNGVLSSTDTDTTYSDATQSVAGLMSTSDKTKLDGIDTNANNYSLPNASGATLGGIKVGTDLTIDGNGVLSVQGGFISESQAIAYAVALG